FIDLDRAAELERMGLAHLSRDRFGGLPTRAGFQYSRLAGRTMHRASQGPIERRAAEIKKMQSTWSEPGARQFCFCQDRCQGIDGALLEGGGAGPEKRRARSHGDRLGVRNELRPADWAKETDRIVLDAIALKIAGDKLFVLTLPGAPRRPRGGCP